MDGPSVEESPDVKFTLNDNNNDNAMLLSMLQDIHQWRIF